MTLTELDGLTFFVGFYNPQLRINLPWMRNNVYFSRYCDAYGGQLPNGEAAAGAGNIPIPPGAGQNPPPPPPPPAAPAVAHAPGPNYWDMMRHMKRCSPEFRRDLAVHHLKDDALVWWEEVVERAHGIRLTWDDFLEAFNGKYFPLKLWTQWKASFRTSVKEPGT
ncbi:hypothetical protein DY000_02033379 [Brassica cretica]|uniref:Retrotransposon gag domain-containing protein n=1 Tax=Brassica cretica TaxID=69181 RepID=A0ABQ7DFF1_BRACR|nr:hypothetical protein DY000_02033379 [Brassica cretica]